MAKGKDRLKKPKPKKSARINEVSEPTDTSRLPIQFSLERCVAGKHCFSKLDSVGKTQFAEAVFVRRTMTWLDVMHAPKGGLGTEKIAKSAITAPTDNVVSEDMEAFLAIRFNGKAPMVGYRIKQVFYVLWFDHDFTLYNHG